MLLITGGIVTPEGHALCEGAVGDMPNASHAWTDHRALAALLRSWWYCLESQRARGN
jgi:hypothetical protein